MKFSFRNLIGVILIVISAIIGMVFSVPIANTVAIIGIVCGATLAISKEVKDINLKGWKLAVYLICVIAGSSILSIGGYSDTTIASIVGAVILIGGLIFGAVINNKTVKKKLEV